MNELDRKTHWGLLETVMWICTRDENRVAALWDMSEEEAMGPVLLSVKTEFDPGLLRRFAETEFDAFRQDAALQAKRQWSRVDIMKVGEALARISHTGWGFWGQPRQLQSEVVAMKASQLLRVVADAAVLLRLAGST